MASAALSNTEGAQAPAAPMGAAAIPLWVVWLGLSGLLLLLGSYNILTFQAQEPDDWMRLLQVRDWVAGQPYFDTRQYRLDPPTGADMHWIRLVDLPIAAFLLLFQSFLPQRAAETMAMIATPLFQLWICLLLLRGLMRELQASAEETLGAMALIALMPVLITNFAPMRVDHHGWQAMAALFATWMVVRGGWREAFAGGIVASAWIFISVEGVALVAGLGGIYALLYWQQRKRDLEGYLVGLALGGPALFLVFRPLGEFGAAYCDMMSWPHFLAFGASAAIVYVNRILPGQSAKIGRLASLVPLPFVAIASILVPLGTCAIAPMSSLDPILQDNWQQHLFESAPIWRQHPSSAVMTVANIVILAIGARIVWQRELSPEQRHRWGLLILAAGIACALSLIVLRGGIIAQLLVLPFSGVIATILWPRARGLEKTVPRAFATVLVLAVSTPALATATGKLFDVRASYTLVEHPKLGTEGLCKYDRLNRLPASHIFVTLDRGPEILGRTRHSAVMGGYHRNQTKMIEVMQMFSGPLDEAPAIVRANNADYVAACTASPDLAAYANMGRDNLADRIFDRRHPAWLEPVEGFDEGALRLYRVVPEQDGSR